MGKESNDIDIALDDMNGPDFAKYVYEYQNIINPDQNEFKNDFGYGVPKPNSSK